MNNYLELMKDILENGEERGDRTGTGTKSLFGPQLTFRNISENFPLVTTKKVHFPSVVHELLWFLQGTGNISYLLDNGVTIWDEWADEYGNLGPVYGVQWRDWNNSGLDQVQQVIDRIKSHPECRRHIVTAWNPGQISEMKLPPCHMQFQLYVSEGKYLSCKMYQRSADLFLGVPFNIASYALLTMLIAKCCDLEAKDLILTFGDVHIYNNHVEQCNKQLQNDTKTLPKVTIEGDCTHIDFFRYEDFKLEDYDCHPRIPAPVAV